MPLTQKGKEVLAHMERTYKSKKKARSVFYAMMNAKKLKGMHK